MTVFVGVSPPSAHVNELFTSASTVQPGSHDAAAARPPSRPELTIRKTRLTARMEPTGTLPARRADVTDVINTEDVDRALGMIQTNRAGTKSSMYTR